MNKIETRPVSKLILNEETGKHGYETDHYLIPSYQRGYRWRKEEQVKALLEDIDDFLNKQRPGAIIESYSLQPIVVVENYNKDKHHYWEVVDGQQRLITLYIILKYLNCPCYEIEFERRNKSTEFLKGLSINTQNHDNPDYHFMSEAYNIIAKWFEEKTKSNISYKLKFATVLQESVQVIWYELVLHSNTSMDQESEKIEVFNRLNIGKIPLEDAELVRALLMSNIQADNEHEKLMRQSELSNEWYEIEQWLRQPETWKFLTVKSKPHIYANRIQLLFELLAKNKNSENYNTYKWFERQIRDSKDAANQAQTLWDEVKRLFSVFRFWYNDRTLYHYIGFLLATNKIGIEDLLLESESEKDVLKKNLHKKIAIYLDSINLKDLSYDNVSKKADLTNILLLFNVLTVEQISCNPQYRFPFNLFNDGNWSFEHIHAQQSQDPIKTDAAIRAWIKETLESIKNIDIIYKDDDSEEDISDLKTKLGAMATSKTIDIESFNELRAKIIRSFESESTKHLLDNLALLSTKDNSSLNNAIFPVKRDRIIKLEKDGHFIPPCTKNVFLKVYSPGDNQPYYWSKTDKELYIHEINQVFELFKKEQQL